MNRGSTEGGWARRVLAQSVASAAAILVVGLSCASPAGAHPDADGHGAISLSDTGDLSSPPSVSGTFTGLSALGLGIETINSISLTATPTGPTGGSQISADGCTMVTSGRCDTGKVSFEWQLPGLAYNGPYVVNATADHCLLSCGPATVTPRGFRMAADPAAPGDVKAEAGGDRNVVLSWQRNAEPDILYYQVSRKDGGGSFAPAGDVRQPASGRPAFTDTATSRTPGGEFAYRVVAVRKGASGDDTTTNTSRASGEKSVTVAPPPTTLPPGSPGAEAKPAGSDTNIAGYLAGQAPALPSPKPQFIDLPDTGYEGTLPFGQLPGEDMSEPGEENASPATLETRRLQEFNRGRPLIPIAAGAILLLLAAHLRLFNKRVKGGPVDTTSAAARFIASLDASKHAPMPLDVDAAVANGGHHRPPSGAALTGLPEWGEFRGVRLLPAAPEEEDVGDEAWAEDVDDDPPVRARTVAEPNGSKRNAPVSFDRGFVGEDEFVDELDEYEFVDELGEGEGEAEVEDELGEVEFVDELAEVEDEFVDELAEVEDEVEDEFVDELDEDEDEFVAELVDELEDDEDDEDEFVAELEVDEDADELEVDEAENEFVADLEVADFDVNEDELVAELEMAEGGEIELVAQAVLDKGGPVLGPARARREGIRRRRADRVGRGGGRLRRAARARRAGEDEILAERERNDQRAKILVSPEWAEAESELYDELDEQDDGAEILSALELDDEDRFVVELEGDYDDDDGLEQDGLGQDGLGQDGLGQDGLGQDEDEQDEDEQDEDEQDEAEVVSELVRVSGPVVMPSVDPKVVAVIPPSEAAASTPQVVDQTPDAVEVIEVPHEATNGHHEPVSDFDDFEWSEEAQFAEPEVEVFVGPRAPGQLATASRRRR